MNENVPKISSRTISSRMPLPDRPPATGGRPPGNRNPRRRNAARGRRGGGGPDRGAALVAGREEGLSPRRPDRLDRDRQRPRSQRPDRRKPDHRRGRRIRARRAPRDRGDLPEMRRPHERRRRTEADRSAERCGQDADRARLQPQTAHSGRRGELPAAHGRRANLGQAGIRREDRHFLRSARSDFPGGSRETDDGRRPDRQGQAAAACSIHSISRATRIARWRCRSS